MTICKYFLQGTCRFGENCKFEHQLGGNEHNYATSTSILLHNYVSKSAQTTTSNVDTNTLVKSVVNDMTSAEKGGQWLLSSYAPFKEKPAFPGFEDHSMEEIRYLFYESMRNGTAEQFKQNLQMMLQQAVMKIKALQNPSPDAVNMLKSIYNTTPSSSFTNNNTQSPFSAAPTNTHPVFAGNAPTQQKSVFGNPPPNQNIFGGSNAPTTVFGSAPAPPMQQNIFGGPNSSNSIFGSGQNTVLYPPQQQASPTKSIFGGPQQTAPNTNTFGGNPVFGGGPVFVGQTSPNPSFAQASPFTQQQTTFQPAQQQNIFQQNAQFTQNRSNPFPPQPPNNQFAVLQASQPVTAGNKPAFQHSANIFGNLVGQQAPGVNMFGGGANQGKPDEDFYSKMEELTEEEIRWFQSDDLDVSKIPEKPPTYEMCFKT